MRLHLDSDLALGWWEIFIVAGSCVLAMMVGYW